MKKYILELKIEIKNCDSCPFFINKNGGIWCSLSSRWIVEIGPDGYPVESENVDRFQFQPWCKIDKG